jgi:hypothetical protein
MSISWALIFTTHFNQDCKYPHLYISLSQMEYIRANLLIIFASSPSIGNSHVVKNRNMRIYHFSSTGPSVMAKSD